MASMSSVTTRGFGNGTFAGSAPLVVTLGYGLGEPADDLVTALELVLEMDGLVLLKLVMDVSPELVLEVDANQAVSLKLR